MTEWGQAEEYLTTPVLANELRQVMGDVTSSAMLDAKTVVVCAREGILVAGPAYKKVEPMCVKYGELMSMWAAAHVSLRSLLQWHLSLRPVHAHLHRRGQAPAGSSAHLQGAA